MTITPHPRALGLWAGAAITAALATTNPVYRGLVVLSAAAVVATVRRRDARLRPLLTVLALGMTLAELTTVLLAHLGTHVLLRIPDVLPLVGGIVTAEAAVSGLVVALGLAASLLAVAPLALRLEPVDIVEILPRRTERLGLAVGSALTLVPRIARTAGTVADAQRMRGWRPGGLRSAGELVVPVVLTAVEDSLHVAEAMEARGFGGAVARHRGVRWTGRDIGIAAAASLSLGALLAARLVDTSLDWFAYPELTTPAVTVLPLVAIALLAVPAVVVADAS